MPLPPEEIAAAIVNEPAGERWYVVHTKPRAEVQAVIHLERQGYTVFYPRCHKMVRHARRIKRVLSPLFPNYLFLRLSVACDQWRPVNSTRGVVRIIMRGDTPEPMPVGIVEALQARMCGDGAIDWTPTFKIGQVVRIADGPFAEFLGTLEYLDGAGRVRVLLDLLGRAVSVALRCEALAPAV